MRAALLLVTAILAAGCATTPPPPALGQPDLLNFLQDGRTTRADTYLKLGPPGREFESGRIATWRLDRDAGGYFLVSSGKTGWRGARYELVVVFGEDGVAQRHSLVEVRGTAE
jgi:hypothetical protein